VRAGVRALAGAIMLTALTACTAGGLSDAKMRLSQNAGDLRLPVASIAARKFATIVRQQYDFSCGSAALATLLTYQYGDPKSEPEVFLGMWNEGDQAQIRSQGFSLLDMKRYLAERGLDGDGYRVSLEQIRTTAVPGIALITIRGYRHFVVVKGITSAGVLMGDPAMGLRTIPAREFEKIWNGVYFVVAMTGNKGRFNAGADWRLAPGARYMQAMEPLSLQALALMSRSYGQF
jgi:predicted double-glycine peptidase